MQSIIQPHGINYCGSTFPTCSPQVSLLHRAYFALFGRSVCRSYFAAASLVGSNNTLCSLLVLVQYWGRLFCCEICWWFAQCSSFVKRRHLSGIVLFRFAIVLANYWPEPEVGMLRSTSIACS